jgi:hypothetical protein
MLGDGHISARDPVFTDHFWLLDWGVPFNEATVHQLVLVGPGGEVKNADGNATGAVNTAGYNIHHPFARHSSRRRQRISHPHRLRHAMVGQR